jgi:hypothetical protein
VLSIPHKYGLVNSSLNHSVVTSLSHSENVRGQETETLSLVVLDPRLTEDRKTLKGIHSYQNRTSVSLYCKNTKVVLIY